MADIVRLPLTRDDTLWAVIAALGRTNRIADIYPDRNAALADRNWREQQVTAYSGFLRTSRQPVPSYSVRPDPPRGPPQILAPLARAWLSARAVHLERTDIQSRTALLF